MAPENLKLLYEPIIPEPILEVPTRRKRLTKEEKAEKERERSKDTIQTLTGILGAANLVVNDGSRDVLFLLEVPEYRAQLQDRIMSLAMKL